METEIKIDANLTKTLELLCDKMGVAVDVRLIIEYRAGGGIGRRYASNG